MWKLILLILAANLSYGVSSVPSTVYKYNVVSNSGILVSNDVSKWNYIDLSKEIQPYQPGHQVALKSIAYGNNAIVVVGTYGLTASSKDEVHWNTNYITQQSLYPLLSVVFYNGKFYTNSVNAIYSSSDGMSWEFETSSNYLNKLMAVNGSLYALGIGKVLRYGNFGWTTVFENTSFGIMDFRTITYGNSTYVVNSTVGNATLTSNDGMNWVTHILGDNEGPDGQTSIFGDNKFIVLKYLSNSQNSPYGSISDDGITWTFNKMTVNNGQGNYGWVWFIAKDESVYIAGGGDNNPSILLSNDGVNWFTGNIPIAHGYGYSFNIAIVK